jgi:predicted flavoprotein YhiN
MGTTGDGYAMARSLGHSIVTPRPAIVGLLCKEDWARELQGLAVADVEVRVDVGGTLPKLATGKPTPSIHDLLFTHFGLSGPAVLNLSEIVAELLEKMNPVRLKIDFARHYSHDQLSALMRNWQQEQGKKQLRSMLTRHTQDVMIAATSPDQTWAAGACRTSAAGEFSIPRRLADMFCRLEQINPEQLCSQLSSGQIHRLVERLKSSRFEIHTTRGFKEAMVTAGGVSLKEVDPQTMQSRLRPHLYLAGEVLDLTGPSGGYNLQLAFSTGHLAGASMTDAV